MKYLVLAATLFAIPAGAQASTWRLTGTADEWPAVAAFTDTDSIRRSGDVVEFVARTYSEGDTASTDHLLVQRFRASCSASTYKIVSEEYYIGTVLQPYQPPKDETITAIDNGIDRNTIGAACGNGNGKYMSEAVDDPAGYASEYFGYLADEESY